MEEPYLLHEFNNLFLSKCEFSIPRWMELLWTPSQHEVSLYKTLEYRSPFAPGGGRDGNQEASRHKERKGNRDNKR